MMKMVKVVVMEGKPDFSLFKVPFELSFKRQVVIL